MSKFLILLRDHVELLTCSSLLLVVFVIYILSPNATSFDSRWVVHTALSIVNEGNTDLDEYLPLLERQHFYGIECVSSDGAWRFPVREKSDCVEGHFYNHYPIGVPALVTPAVAALDFGLRAIQPVLRPITARMKAGPRRDFLLADLVGSSMGVEVLLASLVVGLAALFMYLAAREFLGRSMALLIGFIFAFCTPAWSMASRGLWQHGPSMLMLSAALLLLLRASRDPKFIRYAGIPLVAALLMRPTNALPFAVLSFFVWRHYRKQFVSYVLLAAPLVVCYVLYSLSVYGMLMTPYASPGGSNIVRLGVHHRIFEALAGNLISPSRGLFVYVPLFLLAVYGMVLFLRRNSERISLYLVAIIIMHWLLISSFDDWPGGHGYGPRYFSDMVPFLSFFLIPVLKEVGDRAAAYRFLLPVAFALLAIVSLWMHWRGATVWACYEWNTHPTDINFSSERHWDWQDPPFLRRDMR